MFLPGESQGRGSLVGCRLWGRTESDATEATQQQHTVKGFGTVTEGGVSSFLELSCFFYDPKNVGNFVPLLFLNPACISGSFQFTYC